MGRVGRNGDPCQRAILSKTDLVDEDAKKEYIAKIGKYFNENIAKTMTFKYKPR